MFILIGFAFLAGIVTILSPCILPVLPIILSSSTADSKKYPWGVVSGFILSFTFFTVFLTTIVKSTGVSSNVIREVAIAVIFAFGLVLVFPKLQILFEIATSRLSSKFAPKGQISERSGLLPGFFVGTSLGLVWTPCVGPILASVIALSLTGSITGQSIVVVLAYALGTSIPMTAILYGGRQLIQKVPGLLRNLKKIQATFGILLLFVAVGLFFNFERTFQTYILEKFPQYGAGLSRIENAQIVQKKLNQVSSTDKEEPKDAPELIASGEWFNSKPLTLESLKGKVVLVDFWTYSCINCIRTLPYLKALHENYNDDGLVIIGVHTPEFEFEKSPKNLYDALKDFDIKYPVFQDNEYQTWRKYSNRFWPAKYLVNSEGKIVYTHFGEGKYEETEKEIVKQLKLAGYQPDKNSNSPLAETSKALTPELYFGTDRLTNLSSPEPTHEGQVTSFTRPIKIPNDYFAFEGKWDLSNESAAPQKGAKLYLNFAAKKVFLVAKPKSTESGKILIKVSNESKIIDITGDKLYELTSFEKSTRAELELEFLDNNVEIFTFTFG